jgi:hypothetical protein
LPLTRPFSIQSMNMPAVVFMPIGLKDLILGYVARLQAYSTISAHNMQTSTSTKSAFDGRNALSPAKLFGDLAEAEKRCASYRKESRPHFSCHRFSMPRSAGRCVVPVTAASQSNQRWLFLVDKGRVPPGTVLGVTPVLAPAPVLRPALIPASRVRLMHRIAIGPTGAAMDKPMTAPETSADSSIAGELLLVCNVFPCSEG